MSSATPDIDPTGKRLVYSQQTQDSSGKRVIYSAAVSGAPRRVIGPSNSLHWIGAEGWEAGPVAGTRRQLTIKDRAEISAGLKAPGARRGSRVTWAGIGQ